MPEVIYERSTLDCIVEVAHAVSLDFVNRPRHYREIPDDIIEQMQNFRSSWGTNPDWPDLPQRAAIYTPLLGLPASIAGREESMPIQQAAEGVRQAATKYSERVYDTGEPMLRQAFCDATVTLQAQLTTISSVSVLKDGLARTNNVFKQAQALLSNDQVAGAFGLPAAPGPRWPFGGNFDGNGAYLIEEITEILNISTTGTVSQQHFIVLQRIAHYGHQTIKEAREYKPDWKPEQVSALIMLAYSWTTALDNLAKLVSQAGRLARPVSMLRSQVRQSTETRN
jgi:hypothetical protein